MWFLRILPIFMLIGSYTAFEAPSRLNGDCAKRCNQVCSDGIICKSMLQILKFNCISACQSDMVFAEENRIKTDKTIGIYKKTDLPNMRSNDRYDLIANILMESLKNERSATRVFRCDGECIQRSSVDVPLRMRREADFHGMGNVEATMKNNWSFGGGNSGNSHTELVANYGGLLHGRGAITVGPLGNVKGDFHAEGEGDFNGNMDTILGRQSSWNGGWAHKGSGKFNAKGSGTVLGAEVANGKVDAAGEYNRDVMTSGNYHKGIINAYTKTHTTGSGYVDATGKIGLFGFGIGGSIIARGGGDVKGDYKVTVGRGPTGWILAGTSENQVKGDGSFDAEIFH